MHTAGPCFYSGMYRQLFTEGRRNMRILAINGGPHKGNTWRLTKIVRKILYRCDKTIVFNEIHLADVDLPFCTGCSNCFRRGHAACPHNKKMQLIMDMIEESAYH